MNGQIVSSGTFVLPIRIAPGGAQPRDDVGVDGARAAVRRAAPGGHLAGDVHVVLDRNRHTQQRALLPGRAARVGLVGLGQCALGEDDAVGVEPRVQALDALEGGLDDLTGRDLPVAHHARLLGGTGVGEIDGVHSCGEH